MFEITVRDRKTTRLMRAVRPIADMGDRANINYSHDFFMLASESANGDVTALLHLHDYTSWLICNVQNGCCGINPRTLHHFLGFHFGEEWSVTFIGDDHRRNIRFDFANDALEIYEEYQFNLLDEAPYVRRDIRELDYERRGVVSIDSRRFRHDLVRLRNSGLLVNVYITHNQLRLSTRNRVIVLRVEMGECVIAGVTENDRPIEFSFSLEHMAAFQNALIFSRRVWILTPRNPENPFMLICPVWRLGKIVFLFHQRFRNLKRKRSTKIKLHTPAKKRCRLQLNEGRGFLLKKAVAPIRTMPTHAVVYYCPNGASLKRSDLNSKLTVVFQINSSSFNSFWCNVDGYTAISTRDSDFCLEDIGEDGKLHFISDRANDRILDFFFEDTTGSTFCNSTSVAWHDVYDDCSLITVDLQYKFKSDVGILLPEFRCILMHLSFFGKLVHVCVTNNLLKPSAVNEKIVLKRRMGNALLAVLQKMTQLDFIQLNTNGFVSECMLLSSAVWILTPALSESPFMLN